jgi:hypothetical protein
LMPSELTGAAAVSTSVDSRLALFSGSVWVGSKVVARKDFRSGSTTSCEPGLLAATGRECTESRRRWLLVRPLRSRTLVKPLQPKEDDHGGSSEDDRPDAAARALK